ncbi:putative GRINL1B complex locus protein 2 [Blomia tropicalis]|nr:putative GRINL1B complex locus protein 2 [Blomia tropicalis]
MDKNETSKQVRHRKIVERRVPPFSVQRLFKSLTQSNPVEPVTIKQNNSVNLDKLSVCELNELLQKQNKLLQNKKLLSKLDDKGKKITEFREKVINAINLREDIGKTNELLEKFSISKDNVPVKTLRLMEIVNKAEPNPIRFNQTKTIESNSSEILKNFKKENSNSTKDNEANHLTRNIKILNLPESIETLELTTIRNKNAMSEQVLRFVTYRDNEFDESDLDSSDDNDSENCMVHSDKDDYND